MTGWECPKCGRCYSYMVKECTWCPQAVNSNSADRFQPKQECEVSPFPCGCRWTYCSKEHASDPKECCCVCHSGIGDIPRCIHCVSGKPAPSKVEEKIQEMYQKLKPQKSNLAYDGYFEEDLRALVQFAREEK